MAHVRQQIRDYVADLLVNFIFDRFGIVIQDRFSVNLEARPGSETGTLYKFRRYALDDAQLPAFRSQQQPYQSQYHKGHRRV